MTDIEKIEMVRVFADDTETSDAEISAFLKLAGRKIIERAYPYDSTVTTVPTRYEILQCEITAYLLNKRGAEGETSHSELGINRTYENGSVPASLINQVVPFCGV